MPGCFTCNHQGKDRASLNLEIHLVRDDVELVATGHDLLVRSLEKVVAGHVVHVFVPAGKRALHQAGQVYGTACS